MKSPTNNDKAGYIGNVQCGNLVGISSRTIKLGTIHAIKKKLLLNFMLLIANVILGSKKILIGKNSINIATECAPKKAPCCS